MVLGELGEHIQSALHKMASSSVVDDEVITALIKDIQRALVAADVNLAQISEISKDIKKKLAPDALPPGVNRRSAVKQVVFEALCALLDPKKTPFEPVKGKSNVIMFIGLQGSGKTTTCTKLAYHYAKKKRFKTALVCADTFRAGAYDQLRQNATKAMIPFYGSYSESDPVRVAQEGVDTFKEEKFEVIIVDTSGRHKQEAALFEEMEQVAKAVKPDEVIFVMDGSIGQAAFDQASAFQASVPVGSVIITKLDGHAKGGGALSAVAATKSPITFIGTGEHIVDLEKFDAKSFVSRLLGMGDIQGLMKVMEEADIKDQKEVVDSIMKGEFNLRMMRDQFENLTNLGPLGQIASMIPGLSSIMPPGREQESADRIKRCMTIMDSMNDQELDSQDLKIFDDSRIRRIAQGSGTRTSDVLELFRMYKPFRQALDTAAMASKKGGPKGLAGLDVSKMLDPKMVQAMGGPAAIQNMMKQFAGGKMPKGLPGMPGGFFG